MKFNRLIPEMDVTDLDRSYKFYSDLGFEKMYERKSSRFMFLEYQGNQIMIQELSDDRKWEVGKLEYPLGRGINFSMEVDDVDLVYKRVVEAGYPIFEEMEENEYSGYVNREFLVLDPDGYLLRFNQDL